MCDMPMSAGSGDSKPKKTDKVRRIEVSQKSVKDSDGKMQKRHVVRAHFHNRKNQGGKGAKAAFGGGGYVQSESTEHDSPDTANDQVNDYMGRMEPDDSSY